MSKAKKILLGIGIILTAIGGIIVATLDGDPKTNQTVSSTIDSVKTGVNMIATSGDTATSSPVETK